mmetsp:Transcript_26073/g.46298  ORF Transcript_26073/g.46298 Transcript_26073/m.46298 type:complete len:115 (-) Transcript_26073:3132-3476(-)
MTKLNGTFKVKFSKEMQDASQSFNLSSPRFLQILSPKNTLAGSSRTKSLVRTRLITAKPLSSIMLAKIKVDQKVRFRSLNKPKPIQFSNSIIRQSLNESVKLPPLYHRLSSTNV